MVSIRGVIVAARSSLKVATTRGFGRGTVSGGLSGTSPFQVPPDGGGAPYDGLATYVTAFIDGSGQAMITVTTVDEDGVMHQSQNLKSFV